ncbi:MAG: hypothetical protein AVDCRST_MAG49-4083 [uncultured Thermomicrobiales bacterium]|uniref:Uncharacterized protein n=1 Tax=uncultured Thermomicrobiales bacterium TaxID=1645740 RepID=A0A6J4VGJ4_9BACT|nr:MAG: hypothetical protein AVDCRST_MAG49-4083 [uncultured Thermomicrobiales bacterium]
MVRRAARDGPDLSPDHSRIAELFHRRDARRPPPPPEAQPVPGPTRAADPATRHPPSPRRAAGAGRLTGRVRHRASGASDQRGVAPAGVAPAGRRTATGGDGRGLTTGPCGTYARGGAKRNGSVRNWPTGRWLEYPWPRDGMARRERSDDPAGPGTSAGRDRSGAPRWRSWPRSGSTA